MKKVIVPLALALVVAASGAAFASEGNNNPHLSLYRDASQLTYSHTTQSASPKMTDWSGSMSWTGPKAGSTTHHHTFLSENGLFGPYGPE